MTTSREIRRKFHEKRLHETVSIEPPNTPRPRPRFHHSAASNQKLNGERAAVSNRAKRIPVTLPKLEPRT